MVTAELQQAARKILVQKPRPAHLEYKGQREILRALAYGWNLPADTQLDLFFSLIRLLPPELFVPYFWQTYPDEFMDFLSEAADKLDKVLPETYYQAIDKLWEDPTFTCRVFMEKSKLLWELNEGVPTLCTVAETKFRKLTTSNKGFKEGIDLFLAKNRLAAEHRLSTSLKRALRAIIGWRLFNLFGFKLPDDKLATALTTFLTSPAAKAEGPSRLSSDLRPADHVESPASTAKLGVVPAAVAAAAPSPAEFVPPAGTVAEPEAAPLDAASAVRAEAASSDALPALPAVPAVGELKLASDTVVTTPSGSAATGEESAPAEEIAAAASAAPSAAELEAVPAATPATVLSAPPVEEETVDEAKLVPAAAEDAHPTATLLEVAHEDTTGRVSDQPIVYHASQRPTRVHRVTGSRSSANEYRLTELTVDMQVAGYHVRLAGFVSARMMEAWARHHYVDRGSLGLGIRMVGIPYIPPTLPIAAPGDMAELSKDAGSSHTTILSLLEAGAAAAVTPDADLAALPPRSPRREASDASSTSVVAESAASPFDSPAIKGREAASPFDSPVIKGREAASSFDSPEIRGRKTASPFDSPEIRAQQPESSKSKVVELAADGSELPQAPEPGEKTGGRETPKGGRGRGRKRDAQRSHDQENRQPGAVSATVYVDAPGQQQQSFEVRTGSDRKLLADILSGNKQVVVRDGQLGLKGRESSSAVEVVDAPPRLDGRRTVSPTQS